MLVAFCRSLKSLWGAGSAGHTTGTTPQTAAVPGAFCRSYMLLGYTELYLGKTKRCCPPAGCPVLFPHPSLAASHAIPFPHPSLPRGSLKSTAGPPGSGSAAQRHRGAEAPLGRARLCLLQRAQAGGPGGEGKEGRGEGKGRREGAGLALGEAAAPRGPPAPLPARGRAVPAGLQGADKGAAPLQSRGGTGEGGTRPRAAPLGPSAERQLLAALHGPRPQWGGLPGRVPCTAPCLSGGGCRRFRWPGGFLQAGSGRGGQQEWARWLCRRSIAPGLPHRHSGATPYPTPQRAEQEERGRRGWGGVKN